VKPRWPGLVFWLGSSFFRVVGYAALVFAGMLMRDSSFAAAGMILIVGHLIITAGEAIAGIEQETKDHGPTQRPAKR
jgi:hypothetical protein